MTVNILDLLNASVPTGPVIPTAGYAVVPNVVSVTNGGIVTYTVSTTNVANGTVLYWTNSGTTVGSNFVSGANSGSFTVVGGTATITRTLVTNLNIQGNRTLILNLRTESVAGLVVATAATVAVIDPTPPPPPPPPPPSTDTIPIATILQAFTVVGPPGPTGAVGATGAIGSVEELLNVDAYDALDGSVLVLDTDRGKWVATTNLEKQEISGGQY